MRADLPDDIPSTTSERAQLRDAEPSPQPYRLFRVWGASGNVKLLEAFNPEDARASYAALNGIELNDCYIEEITDGETLDYFGVREPGK